jgi:hypothetical protein
MSFDIVKQDFSAAAEVGYTYELKLPDGRPSGAKLTIIGDLSKKVKAYGRQKFSEFQQRAATAKRKGKDLDQIDLDEAEDSAIESALVRLIGWEGITENGKPVEFSKEKAGEILRNHPWIRESIMDEAGDVTNFRPE